MACWSACGSFSSSCTSSVSKVCASWAIRMYHQASGATYALDHSHLVLVGGLPTFRVWSVSVAVLAVVLLLPRWLVWVGGLDLGDGGVQARDMFPKEGSNCLADETGRHVDEAGLVLLLLLWPSPVAVEQLVEFCTFDLRGRLYLTVLGVRWTRRETWASIRSLVG